MAERQRHQENIITLGRRACELDDLRSYRWFQFGLHESAVVGGLCDEYGICGRWQVGSPSSFRAGACNALG